MKKLLIMALLATSMSFTATVSASGIPTVDVAAILQSVTDALQRAKEFQQQILEAKNRLEEMQNQGEHYKDMVDGHFDFETVLNDSKLNEDLALNEWKDIYDDSSDLQSLRDEFGMISSDPVVQKKYDQKLQAYNAQSKFYKISTERNKNLTKLLDQFSTATNPAAKADLANSIQFENARIKNDAKMMETMTALMEQSAALDADKRANERMKLFRGTGIPIDYSAIRNNSN